MTEQQAQQLSFAYGNLACTTNHKPSRAAFHRVAIEDVGITEEEFEGWASDKEWREWKCERCDSPAVAIWKCDCAHGTPRATCERHGLARRECRCGEWYRRERDLEGT